MDIDPGKLDLVLLESIQPGFVPAPLVAVTPVCNQRLEIRQIGAVLPVVFGYFVSPARICEAVPEVGEHIVADMQGERGEICSHGASGFGSGIVTMPHGAVQYIALGRLIARTNYLAGAVPTGAGSPSQVDPWAE